MALSVPTNAPPKMEDTAVYPIDLKKAAGIAAGSGEPNKEKVGRVTRAQVAEIAKTKMEDLNARTEEAACRVIEGTARSMGIEVR